MRSEFVRRAVSLLFVFAVGAVFCRAQQYKVLTSSEILVLQSDADALVNVRVFDPTSGAVTGATAKLVPSTNDWWDIVLNDSIFKVSDPPMNYVVTYSITAKGKAKEAAPLIVSPAAKLSIAMNPFGSNRAYDISTNVALKAGNSFLLSHVFFGCGGAPGSVNVNFSGAKNSKALLGMWVLQTGSIDDARQNPGEVGSIYVCLTHSLPWLQANFAVDSNSAQSSFPGVSFDSSLVPAGGSPAIQFADSAAFGPPPAPASKDAASFYANLQIAAGTGASGAWGLDGKIALLNLSFLRGTLTLASATANTGNNTSNITGTTYTDSIDWMLPASWAKSVFKSHALTTLTLTAGPKYETDINFDKKNFVFSGDTQWTPARWYQTQSFRSKLKNGALPKYGDPGYASFGYGFELHAGVDSGGALIDTTAKNKKKTQSIKVPAYGIERVVPQTHALWQQSIGPAGLLTVDSSFISRYLFETENTVREAKDGSLSIKQVSGWKAIHTLTSTWNPPRNGNVGITATYKNGFDQPKFSRVNSVLIGVLIQF